MDLMLIPEEAEMNPYTILIEFKYLKKGEKKLLEETKKIAKEQIMEYGNLEEIKKIKKLIKYTVVVVNDEIYVDKI